MAFIEWTFRKDLNSSLNYCETDLKQFKRPLVVILQSYLKTPRRYIFRLGYSGAFNWVTYEMIKEKEVLLPQDVADGTLP